MFELRKKANIRALAKAAAIDRSQAVIEFKLDGTIVTANENFLKVMEYSLDEITGQHHSMFVEPAFRDDPEYREFWTRLNHGDFHAGQYKRIAKGGREVWIQATYNPILDASGKPIGVIKFATDITAQKMRSLEDAGKIAAISRVQAVIEFDMNGTIITANQNFLDALGYSLADIKGKHHSMFVIPAECDGTAYREFWARLNGGQFEAGEFKRIAKGGREIWIMASYNPILDDNGKPFKVVKFATDVTPRKLKAADDDGQISAIGKSQAVIEFNMDGTIRAANPNFLAAMGYSLAEIQGRHHRMFVDSAEAGSPAYRDFWDALGRGQFQAGEYKRLTKSGRDIWFHASYNPILDPNGKPYKVVKYASDITVQAVARQKAENARGLISAVAAGSEEMTSSIREIAQTMSKSKENAAVAAGRVEAADGQAQKLSAAAQSMRGIVELISSITGQINLLALNATIESARAGEAGRGFAVVASEVKNLANQAKQATDTISTEIDSLNGITAAVVGSLGEIKDAIADVNEFITTTAAAVEEQSTVTQDMSANMQRASAELAM